MKDSDLVRLKLKQGVLASLNDCLQTVRRLSLTALNAAARNKPGLIRDHLASLLPLLYAETAQKPELIHVVDMGPWKHRVDDGLETRKIAFETMYTIVSRFIYRQALLQC